MRDVDSVVTLDATLCKAVESVAARHGLVPRWLNDHARPFAPQTLREQDCDVLADLPALRVLGAPLDQVFLMKLHATRVRTSDVEDMVALWPRTGFASAAQAVELLVRWLAATAPRLLKAPLARHRGGCAHLLTAPLIGHRLWRSGEGHLRRTVSLRCAREAVDTFCVVHG